MKLRLLIILVGLSGLSLPAYAQIDDDRDVRYHFNYFTLEHVSFKEDTSTNFRVYRADGPRFRFAKNFSRFFHIRGELKHLGYENIEMDRKVLELGVGASFISTERHNLYAAITLFREEIEGNFAPITNGELIGIHSFSIDNYAGIVGYRQHIRPGVQASYELKASIPDVDGANSDLVSTRMELGLRLHPPTNDKISLGVRLGFETMNYAHLSPEDEEDARDISLFMRVDY